MEMEWIATKYKCKLNVGWIDRGFTLVTLVIMILVADSCYVRIY